MAAVATTNDKLDKVIDLLSARAEADARTIDRPGAIKGAPNIVEGEMPSSRPFSLVKAIGVMSGIIAPEDAKVEWGMSNGFRKVMKSAGYVLHDDKALVMPMGQQFLTPDVAESEPARLYKSMEAASQAAYDPDESAWLQKRFYKSNGLLMSYLDESKGGALVPPPQYMGLIDIYRNNSFFDQVGIEDIALPPQGRIVMSRQTGVTTAYWVGEGDAITQSGVTTGQFELNVRKCAGYTYMPNELIRFATPSADMLVQNDIGKSLALKTDLAGLTGTGGTYQPKGLLNYTGTNEVIQYASSGNPTASNIGTNGNYITPSDGDLMLGLLEDRNFTPDAFAFRPSSWRKLRTTRADAVTAGDQAGLYLVNPTRAFQDTTPDSWDGLKVAKTAQIEANRTKGTATNLTYVLLGQWKDNTVRGRFGAVEFLASNTTNDALSRDLTYIRGLMFVDFGFKRPGGFCLFDQLIGPRAS